MRAQRAKIFEDLGHFPNFPPSLRRNLQQGGKVRAFEIESDVTSLARHRAQQIEKFYVGYVSLYRKPLREAQKFLVISDVTLLPMKEENGAEVDVETPQCSQHLRSLSWPYLKRI